MKFKFQNELIFLPLNLCYQGTFYYIENCILDSGSATSAIDINRIPLNYKVPTQIRKIYGIGGTQEVIYK